MHSSILYTSPSSSSSSSSLSSLRLLISIIPGAMNIFFVLRHRGSDTVELVTAPLDRGDILPGVTRRSILELARGWSEQEGVSSSSSGSSSGTSMHVSERWLPMSELVEAAEEGRLLEAFGAGKKTSGAHVGLDIICINLIHILPS